MNSTKDDSFSQLNDSRRNRNGISYRSNKAKLVKLLANNKKKKIIKSRNRAKKSETSYFVVFPDKPKGTEDKEQEILLSINSNEEQSNSLLPPLPNKTLPYSVSLAPLSLQDSASLSPSKAANTASSSDFDRSLHLRRSKRYIKQSAPLSNLIAEELNASGIFSASSPFTMTQPSSSSLVFNRETSAKLSTNQTNSTNLSKAMSTPSLIEKLTLETADIKLSESGDLSYEDRLRFIYKNDINNNELCDKQFQSPRSEKSNSVIGINDHKTYQLANPGKANIFSF